MRKKDVSYKIIVLFLSIMMWVNSCIGFTVYAQDIGENIPDYDIWMADAMIFGMNNQGNGVYPMFQSFQEPVYSELGGYLLEDAPLVSLSVTWSIFLNNEYRQQFANEQKYIYEVLLMSYLKYDADSEETSIELDNNELKFSRKLYDLLVKYIDDNKGQTIIGMTVEDAIAYYDKVGALKQINTDIQELTDDIENVKELINVLSEYSALQQVKEERVYLLKNAREACASLKNPNKDFIKAADELVKTIEGSPLQYAKGKTLDYIWKKGFDFLWGKLCDANPVLKGLDLGLSGLDVMFDSTNMTSNNLKLALLYTLDCYMKQGMMSATSGFMDNKTAENGKNFLACFRAYVQFQMYGNDYAKTWLEAYLDSGALSNIINVIFNQENIKTAKELIERSDSQTQNRKNILGLIDKYADIYRNTYKNSEWEEFMLSENIPGTDETSNLRNPRIEKDSGMEAGQKVTWDCVWFGSYPQAEVVPLAANYTAVDRTILQKGDIIESSNLYDKLQNATGWNANNDITIEGSKYHRMKMGDATSALMSHDSGFYHWSDSLTYHYFKYEPIKWRVLEAEKNQILLVSDEVLDEQQYNTEYENTTWETSTIRSWLNGYSAVSNKDGTDYSNNSFINAAFSSSEKAAIEITSVQNDDNIFNGTDGGNDTEDRIFLPSELEVYGDDATSHGFASLRSIEDGARRCRSSVYAKAMGTWHSIDSEHKRSCSWWLRSPGYDAMSASTVTMDGCVDIDGCLEISYDSGVRPALHLNLSSDVYSYAGTVSSNGKENEGNQDVHEPAQSIPDTNPTQNTKQIPALGTILKDAGSKATYKVTAAGKTVEYKKASNKKATSVSIPGKVKINDVTYKVTGIAPSAFKNCKKLKKVTIGANVTLIGKQAFYGCKSLKMVTVKSKSIKKVGSKAFKGIHKKASIKVPKSKMKAYKKLFKKGGAAKSVKIKK